MNYSSGDTAWLLLSSALVMLMIPGLALFYGGMVKGKNVLSTFMHSFFALGIITIQWVVIGYSLAFGDSHHGLIGGFDHLFLERPLLGAIGAEDGGTPGLAFIMFQGMFAIITPALISGAFAERMKFSAYCVFTLLWATLVYDPLAHWVWASGGWLFERGALDFAGGTVVHLSSGISALIVALVIGKRRGYPERPHTPHNLTMTVLGAGLLWFGWFGFNAGSALAANGTAALAFANTHIAAGAGALSWALVEQLRIKKVTMLGVASGLVAGLVCITPAAGFVEPTGAIAIGLLAGVICYGGVLLKGVFKYDDSLDAFGVHGVGGMAGAILTGVFAKAYLTPDGVGGGLLSGDTAVFVTQLIGVGAALAYSVVVTFVLVKVIDKVIGLRVDPDTELEGLDGVLHGETGYTLGVGATLESPTHVAYVEDEHDEPDGALAGSAA
ncbi:MAG: ammonium transporter [Kofleriaceae bacterium]|nr:ammonium transporter [Kofleriaceae bacterium]MCB9574021.1 ammonium transporter [Kofleriaceae bacterium]